MKIPVHRIEDEAFFSDNPFAGVVGWYLKVFK